MLGKLQPMKRRERTMIRGHLNFFANIAIFLTCFQTNSPEPTGTKAQMLVERLLWCLAGYEPSGAHRKFALLQWTLLLLSRHGLWAWATLLFWRPLQGDWVDMSHTQTTFSLQRRCWFWPQLYSLSVSSQYTPCSWRDSCYLGGQLQFCNRVWKERLMNWC